MVQDKEDPQVGRSLFHHENGRSSNFFHRKDFEPEFNFLPEIPNNVTWVNVEEMEIGEQSIIPRGRPHKLQRTAKQK